MNDDQKEFKKIESRPLLFQIGDRYVVMGRDFLGVNGIEIESFMPFQGLGERVEERTIRIGGEEILLRVESQVTLGPATALLTLKTFRGGQTQEKSLHTFMEIRGIVADYKNWPLMLFKPKEILISDDNSFESQLRFLHFDRVPLRLVNKPLNENSDWDTPYPWIVWNHRYGIGQERIKLVYLEYHRMKWRTITVVDDREWSGYRYIPVDFRLISIFNPSRFNKAAELWVYRNGKRTQSFIFDNYVRQRDKNFSRLQH